MAAFAGVAFAIMAAAVRSRIELTHVVPEEGVLELFHPWNWLACAVLGAFGCTRRTARRDVWFFFWIAFLSILGALRELDYHVVLNPDNIHYLGLTADHAVRFRIDWWSDPATPIGARVAWAAAIGFAMFCLFVPLVLARVRWKRLVMGLDAFAWMFGAGCGFIGLGWVFDDIILRLYTTSPGWGKLAEEGVETLGQLLIFVSLCLAMRRSPHARAVALLHKSSSDISATA